MTGKERIKTTLNHRDPDRVAMDFGGTHVSGMHVTAVAALRDHYGLKKEPVKVCDPYQMLGEIEDDLRDVLGIDTVPITAPNNIFGFRNENWKEFRTPWGQEVLVSEHFKTTRDSKGDILVFPQGDENAPPSGRMPVGGYFIDTIVRQKPIDDNNLNPEDNLEEFQPISDEDLEYYRGMAEKYTTTDRAVVGGVGGTAIGDIALVPAPFLKHPKGIRDISEWYMSTVMRQDYLHQVFSRQTDIALENLEKVHNVVEELFDVLFICGTDFGTQTSSFCSPETYDSLYSPYYKKINDWIHKNTSWKTMKHSCGAVENFMSHFIESGFDIINPVQCSAAGMDPKTLKDRYGDDLVFWGGAIDTQQTLPFGTPEQVRAEVLSRCEIFAPGGGFVFNGIHNIQARTPVENLIAMFEAFKEYNG
jgi:hypothetical protein